MHFEDLAFAFFLAFVVAIGAVFVSILLTRDHQEWAPAPDGCYIMTDHTNRMFGEDSTTVTEFCPVD